jgi:hypothetical protein
MRIVTKKPEMSGISAASDCLMLTYTAGLRRRETYTHVVLQATTKVCR